MMKNVLFRVALCMLMVLCLLAPCAVAFSDSDVNMKPVEANVLTCTRPLHTHTSDCYAEDGPLICGLEQHTEHVQGECYLKTEKWYATAHMAWETTQEDKFNIDVTTLSSSMMGHTYLLTINTQAAVFDTEQVQVRVPYALLTYRNGTEGPKPELDIPYKPNINPDNSYYYYIDRKDTSTYLDDEIVITNHSPIQGATNFTMHISYEVDPTKVIDCNVAEITGKLTAKGSSGEGSPIDTEAITETLTHRLDTGLKIEDGSVQKYRRSLLYSNVEKYSAALGNDDVSNYNFIEYEMSFTFRGNQPYHTYIKEVPGQDGIVVDMPNFDYDPATDTWKRKGRSGFGSSGQSVHRELVIVAYPRKEDENGVGVQEKYTNQFFVQAVAADEHDRNQEPGYDFNDVVQCQSNLSTTTWKDYVFNFTGDIYSLSKHVETFSNLHIGTSRYGEAGVVHSDFSVSATVNGYELNDYQFDLFDCDLFWKYSGDDDSVPYTRMTEADYEIVGDRANDAVSIRLTTTGIDRTNGATITYNMPEDPFLLMGKTSINGEWVEIAKITEKEVYLPNSLFEGKGYVGLMIRSPKGLQEKWDAYMKFQISLKADSPFLQALHQRFPDFAPEKVGIWNVDGLTVYEDDGQGNYVWANRQDNSDSSIKKYFSVLFDEDKAQFGDNYVQRKIASMNIRDFSAPAISSSKSLKGSAVNNTTESRVDYQFNLNVYYETSSQKALPESYREAYGMPDGVFYDLLPPGFILNENAGIDVRNAHGISTSYLALDRVEVTDDYKGTGRQLVAFHVKNMGTKANNWGYESGWSRNRSGYTISYSAYIPWEDAYLYDPAVGYNLMVFQAESGEALYGGEADDGVPDNSSYATAFATANTGDAPLLADINGDGDTTTASVRYNPLRVTVDENIPVQTGISKVVRPEGGVWDTHTVVPLNGKYDYRLSFFSSSDSVTEDLIFFDILEEAANTVVGAEGDEEAGWKGKLVGIDVSKLIDGHNIEPVVYYSTVPGLEYKNRDTALLLYTDGADPDTATFEGATANWRRWDFDAPPAAEELAQVTALAFDLRKTQDGQDFVMNEQTTLSLIIHMQAPSDVTESKLAYNRPSYFSTLTAPGGEPATEHNVDLRVTVELGALQEMTFTKWGVNPIEGEPDVKLHGVNFNLYMCTSTEEDHEHTGTPGSSSSCWGTKAVQTATSDAAGEVSFKRLNKGDYALKEMSIASKAHKISSGYWTFTVTTENGGSVTKPEAQGAAITFEGEIDSLKLTNQLAFKNIKVQKVWSGGAPYPAYSDVTIILLRDGVEYARGKLDEKGYITFSDLPAGTLYHSYTYTVDEVPIPGYVLESSETSGSTLKLTNSSGRTLTITKRVRGAETDQKFDFELILKDDDQVAIVGTFPATLNDEEIPGGLTFDATGKCADIQLGDGDKLKISGLPPYDSYYYYKLKEKAVPGYTTSQPQTLSQMYNDNGYVTVTNTYSAKSQLRLMGTKTVNGERPGSRRFTFSLNEGDQVLQTIQNNPNGGFGFVLNFTQADAGRKVYTIKEEPTTLGGVTIDPVVYTLTIDIKDNGDGTLDVDYTLNNGTTDVTELVFANTYESTGELSLTAAKTVNGAEPADHQVYDFTLYDASGNELQTKKNVKGAIAFDAIPYTLTDAGQTYTYTVKETTADGSGVTVDATEYTVTAAITDNGDGTLNVATTLHNGTEEVRAISFANTYAATGNLTLTATKTVNGEKPGERIFEFDLFDSADKLIETQKNDADGKITFSKLDYTLADVGTKTYTIKEKATTLGGVTVDPAVYTVTVDITDNHNGTLTATPAYQKDGETATEIAFANTYAATGNLTLTASKTVNDEKPGERIFEFDLFDSAGKLIETQKNDADGKITFSKLDYTLADVGTKTYTIKEKATTLGGITVDPAVYAVTVTITDNGDGTLTVTPAYQKDGKTADSIAFANVYEAKGSLTLYASKTVNGAEPADYQVFDFALYDANGDKLQDQKNKGATIKFDAIQYTLADAGKTYTYTVKEATANGNGMTVDTSEYMVEVKVEDGKNGSLIITPTIKKGTETVNTISFANTYEATGKLALTATKTVNGAEPADYQVFDFTLTDANGKVLQTKQNAKGAITFDAIQYALADAGKTYTYKVKETTANGSGMIVDTTEYTVTAVITDKKDGMLDVATIISNGTEEVAAITFANTYEATGKLALTATKTVNGAEPADYQVFDFTLTSGENTPAVSQTKQNVKDAITFDAILYTLADAGKTYTYTVKEATVNGSGMTVDTTEYTVTAIITDKKDGTLDVATTISNGTEEVAAITFANTYEAKGELSLKATKTVNGVEPADYQVFDFTLTSGENTPAVNQTKQNAKGAITFDAILYTLADAGKTYTYTVKEATADGSGMTVDTTEYTVTAIITDKKDGTLDVATTIGNGTEEVAAITFANTYEAKGELSLTATKTVNGAEPADYQVFDFTLTSGENTPAVNQTKQNAKGAITFDAILYALADAGKTYTYKVKETTANGSGMTVDTTEYTVTAVITDKKDGTLDVATTINNGTEDVANITFANTYEAKGKLALTATKTVNGAEPADYQVFDFTLTDANGKVLQTKQNQKGAIAFDALQYTLADAGKTYTYKVKETTANGSGMIVDTTEYTVTAIITDKKDGMLDVATIISNGTEEVAAITFANTYEATGKLALTATKTVNGAEPADYQVFDFTLTDANGKVLQTKQNQKGAIAFDAILYTLADAGKTYTYKVKEATTDGTGMTVDTTEYTVTAIITDKKDGTLDVATTIHNGTEDVADITFANTYEATGKLALTATKTVNGAEPADYQVFDFTLTDANGKVLQTKQNQKGAIAFDALPYTLADAGKTYTYTVKEATANGSGMTVDATEYTVTAVITDKKDGTLDVATTISNGTEEVQVIAFNNQFAGDLTITKSVAGNAADLDKPFTFTVKLDDASITGQYGDMTFDKGVATFQLKHGEKATAKGLPDGTAYTVTETVADDYVSTKTGDTGKIAGGTDAVAAFTNTRDVFADLTISKTVKGGDKDQPFTFTVTLTNANDQPLTDAFVMTGSMAGSIRSGETVQLKHGESIRIAGLPYGTKYTVTETTDPRYLTSVNGEQAAKVSGVMTEADVTAAFENTFITCTFTVRKEWQGGDGDAIKLTLYANGEKLEPQPEVIRDGDVYTYTDLPRYDEKGEVITYAAKEKYMDGYMTIYRNTDPYAKETDFIYDGGTVINRAVMEIAVQKVWTGLAEGEEAPDIKLTLYCDGEVVKKSAKADKHGWYHFYNLPIRTSPYYVMEEPVEGFAATYENPGAFADVTDRVYDGGTITNHKIPKTSNDRTYEVYGLVLVGAVLGMIALAVGRKKARKH